MGIGLPVFSSLVTHNRQDPTSRHCLRGTADILLERLRLLVLSTHQVESIRIAFVFFFLSCHPGIGADIMYRFSSALDSSLLVASWISGADIMYSSVVPWIHLSR